MHKPDFTKRILEGELHARKWRAEYMRPSKYAVTKISMEREPRQWITLPGIATGSFATVEEVRAAIERRVESFVASGGKP
jgi:expansin (peptidoglycan-binding protein)